MTTTSLKFVVMHDSEGKGDDKLLAHFQKELKPSVGNTSFQFIEQLNSHGQLKAKLTLTSFVKKERRPAIRPAENTLSHLHHEFKLTRFVNVACNYCQGIMMFQGYKCKNCQMPVHKHHIRFIIQNCPSAPENTKQILKFNLPHSFIEIRCLGFSRCNSCGRNLIGRKIISCKTCNNTYHIDHKSDGTIHNDCNVPLTDMGPLASSLLTENQNEESTKITSRPPTRTITARRQVVSLMESANLFKKMIENNQKLHIPNLEDLDILNVLGRGAYGKVFKVQLKNDKDKRDYALKAMKKSEIIENEEYEIVNIEKIVSSKGNLSPFLAGLHSSFQNEKYVFFLMEFISGGDLFYHLQHREKFSEDHARFYAAEIALGLIFLHQEGIIHRDMKPDNILLDKHGHVKIADFGLSKMNITGDNTAFTMCGTHGYMAPEVIKQIEENDNNGYGISCDWWSYGVILFEMLTGRLPFDSDDEGKVFEMVLKKEVDFSIVTLSKTSQSIIKKLLKKNPSERLSSQEGKLEDIKKEKFFKSIDWVQLDKRIIIPPYQPQSDKLNVDDEFAQVI